MQGFKKYFTGYITFDWDEYPSPPYGGKNWYITFLKTEKIKRYGSTSSQINKNQYREITINALSFQNAQNALYLINCALWLTHGGPFSGGEIEIVTPADNDELIQLQKNNIIDNIDLVAQPSSCCSVGFPLACMIAAKASFRNTYKYALAKYRLASQAHSVFWHDMDPFHATQHLGVSSYINDHVRFAFSIIASYSVIEELGLEIRATKDNPSAVNGKWNYFVKENLENRLIKAGVILDQKVLWNRRGKPTKIEKAKRPPSKGKCTWSRGPYVRDCEIEVIDAINIASYYRSKVSSHKLSPLVASLNSYDVENVRNLARRLLLDRLGFRNI
jgi:hypothetical protein